VRQVASGQAFSFETGGSEAAVVVLGGVVDVRSSVGEWVGLGDRATVFDGLPFALYLPPAAHVEVSSAGGAELAVCLARSDQALPPRLIRPDDIAVELRGEGNASRNIYHVIPPEFPAHRLLVVEVLTPPGHWSSYPPHKHDEDRPPQEVDLEEIYYHRQEPAQGFAVQHVYTDARDLDETLTVGDGDLVLVPRGYHVVAQAYGYRGYYLNVLAGDQRSMAAADDAAHAWIRKQWMAAQGM
jgi:5-deoxy-glucuronate isomerase